MLVPILILLLALAVFAFLVSIPTYKSNDRCWRNEVGWRSRRISDLEKLYEESENELRVAVASSKWPPVRVSPVVQKLFAAYGGPERAASRIADAYSDLNQRHSRVWEWMRQSHRKRKNFQRLWKRYRNETRQLREELHLVRGLYEDAAGV